MHIAPYPRPHAWSFNSPSKPRPVEVGVAIIGSIGCKTSKPIAWNKGDSCHPLCSNNLQEALRFWWAECPQSSKCLFRTGLAKLGAGMLELLISRVAGRSIFKFEAKDYSPHRGQAWNSPVHNFCKKNTSSARANRKKPGPNLQAPSSCLARISPKSHPSFRCPFRGQNRWSF